MAMLLPFPCYLLITLLFFPVPNSGLLAIGCVGTLFLGISLMSLVGLLDKMYFGHLITFGSFGLAVLFIGAGSVILYTPAIYELFDQKLVTLYIFIFASFILPSVYYVLFRSSVKTYARNCGASNSTINKLTKGKANYWLYESLNNQYNLGLIYNVNKLFVFIYPCLFLLHLTLGWIRCVCVIDSIIMCVLILLSCFMWVFAVRNGRIEKESTVNNKDSTVMIGIVFALIICFAIIKSTLNI